MSVHMFRAQLSRMNGEKEDMDPLAHIFNDKNHKSSAAPGAEDTRVSSAEDTRGILTRVVHQTQSVAGVFSGMGDFVMDIMIQSPPPKSNSETAAASDEAMPSARLHFFRLDEDNLVEQEYHSNSASGEKTNLRSRDVLYVF